MIYFGIGDEMIYKLDSLQLKKFCEKFNIKCSSVEFVLSGKKWYVLIDEKVKLRVSKKIADFFVKEK